MKKLLGVSAVAVIAVASAALPAGASISYSIGAANTAISPYPGPYGTLTVNRTNSATATITLDSLTSSGNVYLFGAVGTVGINVNATTWTLGTITGSNAGTGFTPGAYSDGGSRNLDGFGRFNQTVNTFGGFTHSSDHVTFTLTNTGGTWSGDSDVLSPNGDGHLAAGHVFVTASPANAANGALATGFAANSGAIPEPSSLAIWALLGLAAGVFRWRN